MTANTVTLAGDDAFELLEALDLLHAWFNQDCHLEASLRSFLGTEGYPLDDLCEDLGRLIATLLEATR